MPSVILSKMKPDRDYEMIPRTIQETIPIRRVYDDGIFQLTSGLYSKSFRFTDINYDIADAEEKMSILQRYSDLLNMLDAGARTKITINNRRINLPEMHKRTLVPEYNDSIAPYRGEVNQVMKDRLHTSVPIVQEKYITTTVSKRNVEEARSYFRRTFDTITQELKGIGCGSIDLNLSERLRIIHDFFKPEETNNYFFDLKELIQKGHDFKDYICPDSLEIFGDHFRAGNLFGRVMFFSEYASYITDDLIMELSEQSIDQMISIDIMPVPTDEAVKEAERKLLGVETNISRWQNKQNQRNNYVSAIPYNMRQQKAELNAYLDDLTTRDQKMLLATVTICFVARSREAMEDHTENIKSIAGSKMCQFRILNLEQREGLNTALPYGARQIHAYRTLTSEAVAGLAPFRCQEVFQDNGECYGVNQISGFPILLNKANFKNGNSWILGVPGSGKSALAKWLILETVLRHKDEADVIVLDPEREYGLLCSALQGQTIQISATSRTHINALDISADYAERDNPLVLKSEFVMSLCEQAMGMGALTASQKSIIDRCVQLTYRDYLLRNYTGAVPTLHEFHHILKNQEEPEARELSTSLALFVSGSLNTFAMATNVNINSSFIVYDIFDLGEHLRPIGMLVVLDAIWNRVRQNRDRGKYTYIFFDEAHQLFRSDYAASFTYELWKRIRKFWGYPTGITQNVGDLLQTETGRTILNNSDILVMLSQGTEEKAVLQQMLGLSEEELRYITDQPWGRGLIKAGNAFIPFSNEIDKGRYPQIYRLITTKPGEG